jgi:uncharacterized membrane protein YgcG
VRIPRLIRAGVVVAALLLPVTAVAPALAAPVPTGDEPDAPAPVAAVPAGVDDFEFASFDAAYVLGRDREDRSLLRTTEHLVAVFPDFDQNRGIRRALVDKYQGHSTGIEILSVTDENGQARPYTSARDGDFLVLTIAVPEGQFVRGEQHYVIQYTQRDVTAYFEDTNDDEFYWDVNGTGWAQPFGRVSATIEVAADLVPALTNGESCYFGYDGSADRCEITRSDATFTAEVFDLGPYQNMTVVVAFRPGTFAPAPFSILDYVPLPALLGLGFTLLGIILALVLRLVVWRNSPGRGTIIAQYEPPPGVSALLAANIVGKPRRGMAAAIVDLAVRRKVRIAERDQGGSSIFGVQMLDGSDLDPDEQRVISALFITSGASFFSILQLSLMGGGQPADTAEVGEVRWLTKGDTVLGQQVVALTKSVEVEARRQGLRRKPARGPIVLAGLFVVLGFISFLISGFADESELGIVIGVFGAILASWIGVGVLVALGRYRPLTRSGSQLLEHLLGLREYIRLAEADRLQMLQSVTGAERVATTTDRVQIIKIYERLLPYAVLFGLEKEWAAELAKYYDTTPPDWYDGNISGFHVAAFAAGIGSLSTSVSTSCSGSSGSSSSGGSGGGGSSGGGGGGGGGGGV